MVSFRICPKCKKSFPSVEATTRRCPRCGRVIYKRDPEPIDFELFKKPKYSEQLEKLMAQVRFIEKRREQDKIRGLDNLVKMDDEWLEYNRKEVERRKEWEDAGCPHKEVTVEDIKEILKNL